jgi:sporulation protein YlmC with PRC-barrel domain
MKSTRYLSILSALLVTLGVAAHLRADPEPSHTNLGVQKPIDDFNNIEVKNFQDESLGRIKDLGIDLINGRIVEVLMVTDSALGEGSKIIAVPPLALTADPGNQVYRLNATIEDVKEAAGIDLSKWEDAGSSDRVAAAYHRFNQEPYFLENGDVESKHAARPRVRLGYVERSSKILTMPVGNLQNQHFGDVCSMTLDIPNGRILTVVVLAPGNFKTKSIVPAMALSFDADRKGLILDDTKVEYADEPRFVLTEAAYGQKSYSREESYAGPHTHEALEQGSSYRDIDRTIVINKEIRAAKLNGRHVQIGTMNGRVTLRGWVPTAGDKEAIGQVAIKATRLELVDNQITVGAPEHRG